MKMLLIDDDEWIRDSLTLFFEGEGCCLTALETAEEAVKVLSNEDYDVIIVDYKLPGMNGLEFLKRIQTSHPRTVKVLITAYGSEDLVSEAWRCGIQDYIEKPFTAEIMEKTLFKLIASKENQRTQSGQSDAQDSDCR